jgi:hypothetical protein
MSWPHTHTHLLDLELVWSSAAGDSMRRLISNREWEFGGAGTRHLIDCLID